MLNDKDFANLTLEMTKHQVEDFTKAALETSGNLRQAFLQIRNQCEQSQERLAQLAIARGWYKPAATASAQEVQAVAGALGAAVGPTIRI